MLIIKICIVKIHSIKIKAPANNGPKTLKLFINQPRTMDFDLANTNSSVQEISYVFYNIYLSNRWFHFSYIHYGYDCRLSLEDITEGSPVELKYVKFQNVLNLQIFVKDNQMQSEKTQINYLSIIGSPIVTTNMGDFKRVAGKRGESH